MSEKRKALQAVVSIIRNVVPFFCKSSVNSKKAGFTVAEEAKSADVVRPGMYYYSDGTLSSEVIQEKQISGVVGWVDNSGRHGLVLGTWEGLGPWSTDALIVETLGNSGKENTRLILEAAHKQNKKAEAAEWCAKYAFGGIHAGEAFLPSRRELFRIFKNLDVIQKALEKINGCLLDEDNWYWSSEEFIDKTCVWIVRPSDCSVDGSYGGKRCIFCYVCAVWEF